MKTYSSPADPRGIQFIGFDSFSKFTQSKGEQPGETILTSSEISTRIHWDELIASWNAEMPTNAYLKIEVRALYPDHSTKWYVMGLWSGDPAHHPRESVRGPEGRRRQRGHRHAGAKRSRPSDCNCASRSVARTNRRPS